MARNHQRSPFKVRTDCDGLADVRKWGQWIATFRRHATARSYAKEKNAEWRKARRTL